MIDKLFVKIKNCAHSYASKIELTLWFVTLLTVVFSLGHLAYRLPLWTDELAVVTFINKIRYSEFMTLWPGNTNLPLYYLLMKFYSAYLPAKEIVLRLPSLLCFVISCFYLWKMARALSATKTFAIPTCLALYFMYSNPMFFFAHEVRPYALQVCLLIVHAYYSYLILWKRNTTPTVLILVAFIAPLCLMTHYYGALYICVNWLFAAIYCLLEKRRRREVGLYLMSHILCLIPIAYGASGVARAFFEARPFWIESISSPYAVTQLALTVSDKGLPSIILLLSPFFLYCVLVGMKKISASEESEARALIYYLALLVTMLAVVVVKSIYGTSVLHYRYLAVWMPVLLLAIGIALSVIEKIIHRVLITGLSLAIFIFHWSAIESKYLLDAYPANDMRSAVNYVHDYVEVMGHQSPHRNITLHTSLWNPEFYRFYLYQHPDLEVILGQEIWVYQKDSLKDELRQKWYPTRSGDQVIFICFESFFCQQILDDFTQFGFRQLVHKNFSGGQVIVGEKL